MEVLLEPIKDGWRAVAYQIHGIEAEAETQEAAIEQIKRLWSEHAARGARIVEVDLSEALQEKQERKDPADLFRRRTPAEFSGSLKGNPLWAEWREAVESYRAERDAEL